MRADPRALRDEQLEEVLLGGAAGLAPIAGEGAGEYSARFARMAGRRHVAIEQLLGCARELLVRLALKECKSRSVLTSPAAVRDYLLLHFAGAQAEAFVVVFLDSQHRVIEAEQMFTGTLAQTSVYPREVVKRALAFNAGAVILAHNHPSGSPEPSRADEFLTQTLKQALSMVDVRVLDHFVVAGMTCVSFAERGLL